jgi:hypothetical protein
MDCFGARRMCRILSWLFLCFELPYPKTFSHSARFKPHNRWHQSSYRILVVCTEYWLRHAVLNLLNFCLQKGLHSVLPRNLVHFPKLELLIELWWLYYLCVKTLASCAHAQTVTDSLLQVFGNRNLNNYIIWVVAINSSLSQSLLHWVYNCTACKLLVLSWLLFVCLRVLPFLNLASLLFKHVTSAQLLKVRHFILLNLLHLKWLV